MKRRVLITLLTLTMTATMITGCGNKSSQSMAAETNQESITESTEETLEEISDEADSSSEDSRDESGQESSEEPVETSAEESTEHDQGTEPVAEAASAAPEESQAPTESEASTQEEQIQAPGYTVTEMSAIMYVLNTVNLRQGPGSSYSKVGSLNKGDQVNVTGQADNGWYQLDNGAFVSNNYLGSTAPAAPNVSTVPADQNSEVIPVVTATVTASTGADFLNYLNQQRSAAGLGTLTWDSGMAAVAQRRAQEITKGLDHSGNVEQYGEIIQQAISGSATEWYTNWYNSEAHRSSMMGQNYTRAGVGVYAIGNDYFVVCNFQGDPITAEEQLEQLKPENLVPAGENESGTTNSFSTTGETLAPDDPNYGFIYDLIEQEREQHN